MGSLSRQSRTTMICWWRPAPATTARWNWMPWWQPAHFIPLHLRDGCCEGPGLIRGNAQAGQEFGRTRPWKCKVLWNLLPGEYARRPKQTGALNTGEVIKSGTPVEPARNKWLTRSPIWAGPITVRAGTKRFEARMMEAPACGGSWVICHAER